VGACQRDNSRTVLDIVKFLWEQDGQKLGRVRKWLHCDALQCVGGELISDVLV